jgi:epoxyqueuosine reductase
MEVIMSKYHSTISRRDFMKALGLAGVGLGAAAATAPVLHDLDEVMSTERTSMQKQPWFIKEVDKPTIEIDLNLRTPFTSGDNAISGTKKHMVDLGRGDEYDDATAAVAQLRMDDWKAGNVPGWLRQDYALADGLRSFKEFAAKPIEGHRHLKTPDDYGVPRYEGTLEENGLVMRCAARGAGVSQVGYIDLDDNTLGPIRSLFYKNSGNRDVVFDDVDDIVYTDNSIIIPRAAKYCLYYQPQNSRYLKHGSPFHVRGQAGGQAARDRYHKSWIQNVIHCLGYKSYGISGPGPPFGILAGVEEYCRVHNGISYELGIMMGGSVLVTDFPLPPTKPISMGIVDWCKICRKCVDICPVGAIDDVKEPHWDRATGPWSAANDHTGWSNHSLDCAFFWRGPGCGFPVRGQCVQCSMTCPFTKEHTSFIHETTKYMVSWKQQWLDKFLLNLDDFFGYGQIPSGETMNSFWELDWPEYIIDPIVRDY